MNILECISQAVAEITELDTPYIGKILIEGISKYNKPVDVMVNEVKIPLKNNNLDFKYREIVTNEKVYKCDSVLSIYYPEGSQFNIVGAPKLKLISYGVPKLLNGRYYVDMNCSIVDTEISLIENIEDDSIKNRVRDELNNIIESNEVIKSLLPEYNCIWFNLDNEDLENIKNFKDFGLMELIYALEYNERYSILKELITVLSEEVPTIDEFIRKRALKISNILTLPNINSGIDKSYCLNNPRYLFEWMLYVTENDLLNKRVNLYEDFLCVTTADTIYNITVEQTDKTPETYDNSFTITLNSPEYANTDYRIELSGCKFTDNVYNIDNAKIFIINKKSGVESELILNTSDSDYLDICTDLFVILFSTEGEETMTLQEFHNMLDKKVLEKYNNIPFNKFNQKELVTRLTNSVNYNPDNYTIEYSEDDDSIIINGTSSGEDLITTSLLSYIDISSYSLYELTYEHISGDITRGEEIETAEDIDPMPYGMKIYADSSDNGNTDELLILVDQYTSDKINHIVSVSNSKISELSIGSKTHNITYSNFKFKLFANANNEEDLPVKYGIKFDGPENSGDTVHRLYGTERLVAGVGTDTETAVNDFDNIYPWSERKRCCGYFDDNGEFIVNAYENEESYTTDGSNGEVWVETPIFYYKHTYGEDGNPDSEEIIISKYPYEGFNPSPIHIRNDGTLMDKAYTAAYPMGLVGTTHTSRSGVTPLKVSLNGIMKSLNKENSNYVVSTVAEQYTKCLLMWVEFGTRDIQSIMRGCSDFINKSTATITEINTNRIIISNNDIKYYEINQSCSINYSNMTTSSMIVDILPYDDNNSAIYFNRDFSTITSGQDTISFTSWITGTCDNVLTSSGSPVSNTSGKYNCIYRGEESPFGENHYCISDILFKREGSGTTEDPYNYNIYYLSDPRKYNNGTITDDYIKLNYQIYQENGYIKKLGYDERYPWIRLPSEVGGSESTYYSDYYDIPSFKSIHALSVNGKSLNKNNNGPTYFSVTDAPRSTSRRARLSYYR